MQIITDTNRQHQPDPGEYWELSDLGPVRPMQYASVELRRAWTMEGAVIGFAIGMLAGMLLGVGVMWASSW